MATYDLPQRLVSGKEAARYTGMSEQFFRKSRMNGNLPDHTPGPPFVKIGRSVRYDIQDLDAWIASHRQHPKGTRNNA